MIKINSEIIKTALMSYYRFKRQWICATEVHCGIAGETADVMVDTETDIKEIEIKCSKQDLWQGEARKSKHKWYSQNRDKGVNTFFICVPTELVDEAVKWVNEINPKYGIIEFVTERLGHQFLDLDGLIITRKKAKPISSVYSKWLKEKIVYRLCSELITMKQDIVKEYIFRVKQEERDSESLKQLDRMKVDKLNELVKECVGGNKC